MTHEFQKQSTNEEFKVLLKWLFNMFKALLQIISGLIFHNSLKKTLIGTNVGLTNWL